MKVYKFEVAWCGPCRAYNPIFKKVSENPKYKDVEFKVIDIDDESDETSNLISLYNVRNIPLTVITNDLGGILRRLPGLQSEKDLTEELDAHLEE